MSKDKEEAKEIKYSPGGCLNGFIFEQALDEAGRSIYVYAPSEAVWRDKTKMHMTKGGEIVGKLCHAPVSTGDHWETDTTEYWPLKKCPWPLCKQNSDIHYWKELADNLNEHELWNDTYQFIYDHLDLPEEPLYDVLTAWTWATWIPEIWEVVPYLFFHGPVASGKTRALEVLRAVSYRGVIGSNISGAALFRSAELWHPTLFLDETEIYGKEHKAEIIGLLNSGYRRGQYAIRVKNTEQGTELDLFDVFGFKALAGTESLRDTLESRSIIVNMMKNVRPIKFLIDKQRALEIRNKLLVWRLLKISDISDISDSEIEGIPSALRFADGRIIELFFCLYQIANEGKENILEYAKKTYEKRLDIEETSLEAEVLQYIVDLEPEVENQFIETKAVANKFNEGRSDKEKWKTRSIGYLIRRLGFEPKRGTGGVRGWKWDSKRIEYLKKRYRIGGGTPNSLSLTSLTSLKVIALSEVKEIKDALYPVKALCEMCGTACTLTKTITSFDGENFFVCEECGFKIIEELKKRDSDA